LKNQISKRIVPELPPVDTKLRIVIDSDAANEIDDLYAIALAIRAPERFNIEGFIATHFAQHTGRQSIEQSYDLLMELLTLAGKADHYPVAKGGDPLSYLDEPNDSAGARFIIDRAHAGSTDAPLWVLGLGAATNLASALLIDPSIMPKVRYIYHARSEWSWPERSEQFNIGGDVRAARVLLKSGVPLVWFDTGTQLTCPMQKTKNRLLPLGGLSAFLHEYRYRDPKYQGENKGFFDLGDIAWIMQPGVCRTEVVDVPHMDWKMVFSHQGDLGQMRRVFEVDPEPVWKLFFEKLG
jgi:purine nucleosidase